MASSGNFPLWSPLIKGATNLSKGNTRFDGTTSSRGAMTSFAVPTGTKFYVECLVTHATGYNIVFGVANPEFNVGAYDESDATMNGILFRANTSASWDTCSLTNGSRGSFGSNVGQTSARVLAMSINRVDNEIKMYLDNSLQHTISISATEVYHIVCSFTGGSNSAIHMNINCGHDSTGAGDFSAGSATDENGFGSFQHSPATGFLAPSSANLPISDDIDPAQTDDNYPQKQCGVVTYTGNATTGQAITGMGFQPDLIIAKMRSSSQSNFVSDTSRGINKFTFTDQSVAEQSGGGYATVYSSFDSDGFTLGTSGSGPNDNGKTYCAWGWRCNGGTTASNSDGDITSTVQVNQAAGFSIVQYTGVSSATTATVGHGLGKAPTFIIHKVLNSSGYHFVRGVPGMASATTVRDFNPNGSPTDVSGSGGALVAPTSTTFNINNYTGIGGGGYNYVAYCWAPIEGYSAFGVYKGNANADGPFIYTGFRPRIVLIIGQAYGIENVIWDTERSTFNVMDDYLRWGRSSAEGSSSSFAIDALSNGFKLRTSGGDLNTSGATQIYACWGDVPFKYNNTF